MRREPEPPFFTGRLILVEGASDRVALETLARRRGLDCPAIVVLGGPTPSATTRGCCDFWLVAPASKERRAAAFGSCWETGVRSGGRDHVSGHVVT
jgi:hypothetical protein